MDQSREARGCSPFARIPQEMAALRRAHQGGGAMPLSSRPRRSGLRHTGPKAVIAGLDPAIHQSSKKLLAKKMDARIKPAHDWPLNTRPRFSRGRPQIM